MDSLLSLRAAAGTGFLNDQRIKHLFIGQRRDQGTEENEVAVTFHGPRTGLASLLANAGSGGAAEYLSSDAIAAIYISTREPQQLLEELLAQIYRSEPSFQSHLAEAEARLGISLTNDLARAFGTESAFAIEGFSLSGPVWVLAAMVNDPTALESSLRRLTEIWNAEMERSGQAARIRLEQEVIEGRAWNVMSVPPSPLSVTWTCDHAYLVAGPDRGTVTRAIGIRSGGSPLVWSPSFQQQLPASAGLHPSGFAWLNTQGALQKLASLMPYPSVQKLIAERDPILLVFSGATEQIRAVSRTRISGLLMDLVLLQGLGRVGAEKQ
jgi:hypothetical protein